MNIYITKDNENLLRQELSMSGLVNELLINHYKRQNVATKILPFEPIVTADITGVHVNPKLRQADFTKRHIKPLPKGKQHIRVIEPRGPEHD